MSTLGRFCWVVLTKRDHVVQVHGQQSSVQRDQGLSRGGVEAVRDKSQETHIIDTDLTPRF